MITSTLEKRYGISFSAAEDKSFFGFFVCSSLPLCICGFILSTIMVCFFCLSLPLCFCGFILSIITVHIFILSIHVRLHIYYYDCKFFLCILRCMITV